MSQHQNDHQPTPKNWLPWALTAVAFMVAGIAIAQQQRAVATPVSPTPHVAPVVAPVTDKVKQLEAEIADIQRILNDAQSALADRDREIATANAELAKHPNSTTSKDMSAQQALHVLQRTLKEQGAQHRLIKTTSGVIGLVVFSHQNSGTLLLTEPLPTLPDQHSYGVWVTGSDQLPKFLTTCTGAITSLSLPTDLGAISGLHIHQDSPTQRPGPVYAQSAPSE